MNPNNLNNNYNNNYSNTLRQQRCETEGWDKTKGHMESVLMKWKPMLN